MPPPSLFSPTRLLRGLACAFYGMGLVLLLPLAVLLSVTAETWTGHLFAVTALAALAAPAAFLYLRVARRLWGSEARKHAVPLQLSLAAVVTGLPLLVWLAPGGNSVPGAAVQSVYLEPASYRRLSPGNLLPEIDQVKLGTFLVAGADPYIDRPQARRLRDLVLPHYRHMQEAAEYDDLGSAMPATYRDFFGLGADPGHFYAITPVTEPDEKLPLLVFLHGSWGNFRFYVAAMESFALEHRVVVVLPTLGFGTWPENDAVPLLQRVLDHCLSAYPVDRARVFLAGISNGSLGVACAAAPLSDRVAGLVFLSPILRQRSFETPAFAEALRGRPVLILHGEDDRRISTASVREGARLLEQQGLRVTLQVYPGEDHFLFVSQLDDVHTRIAEFIRDVPR